MQDMSTSVRHIKKRRHVKVESFFHEVNSDVLGPLQVQSICGHRYAITFTEVKSRYRWVYFMKTKDEALDKLKLFLSEIKVDGFKLKELRTDNGGEYVNDVFKDFAKGNFKLRTTPPHTPTANAIAERFNRVLGERTRAMLKAQNLPKYLWADAMKTVTYTYNRTLGTADNGSTSKMTPFEMLKGYAPDIKHLRMFGCKAYAYNFDIKRKKLDDRAHAGIMVGYDELSAAYRIYIPSERKIMKSGHVIFNERSRMEYGVIMENADIDDWFIGLDENGKSIIDVISKDNIELRESHSNSDVENELSEAKKQEDELLSKMLDLDAKEDRPHRDIERLDYKDMHNPPMPRAGGDEAMYSVHDTILYALTTVMADPTEPKTYDEAIESEYWEEWEEAICNELSSIYGHGTWHEDVLPEGVKPLTTKWVFKIKRGDRDQIEKFKARLCVRGFEQEQGVDYDEVFSPVMRHNSLRTLLSIAAANDLEIEQLDVRTAFLEGTLEEDVYITVPQGTDHDRSKVLKLDKALYGTKQGPRVFNNTLNDFLVNIGFKRCTTDPCVYTLLSEEDDPIYLGVYVDDMIIIGADQLRIARIKADIKSRFDIDDKGPVDFILGMKVERDRENRMLYLHQEQYAKNVIKKFNMLDSKCKIGVPMSDNLKLSKDDCPQTEEEKKRMASVPYRSAIGALMYLATCTRPDISYAVSVCASFMQNPGYKHWMAVKNILAYVNSTKKRGLSYGTRYSSEEWLNYVYLYADADHAGDVDKRRSRTGYVTLLNGGAVSWKTRLQDRVAMSSTEAEYYALAEASSEAVWFRMLMNELHIRQLKPTAILEDNESAINLAINPIFQTRTKQIEIRHHVIRDLIRYKEVIVNHISTSEQLGDAFTKALSRATFMYLTNGFMTTVDIE